MRLVLEYGLKLPTTVVTIVNNFRPIKNETIGVVRVIGITNKCNHALES